MQGLELSYVPDGYWNNEFVFFKIRESNLDKVSEKSSFFVLWIENGSKERLDALITENFPHLPLDKLIFCEIGLAFPQNKNNKGGNFFELKQVVGRMLPLYAASKFFFKLRIDGPKFQQYSNSIKTWIYLTKFVYEMLNKGNFAPLLEKKKENLYSSTWKILFKTEFDNQRFKKIIQKSHWKSYNLAVDFHYGTGKSNGYTSGLWHPSYLFLDYTNTLANIIIRTLLKRPEFQSLEEYYYNEIKEQRKNRFSLSWDYRFLKSIVSDDNKFRVYKYHETVIPNIIDNWSSLSQNEIMDYGLSLVFQLEYPTGENKNWPLKLHLKAREHNNLILLEKVFEDRELLNKFVKNNSSDKAKVLELILKSLGNAIRIFNPIERMVKSSKPKRIYLNSEEVMSFFSYSRHLLIQNGFNVILPDVFNRGGKQRLSMKLIISSGESKGLVKQGRKGTTKSFFGIGSLLDYRWEGSLSNETLSTEELEKIIKSETPLLKWRDEWILVESQDIKELKNIFLNSTSKKEFAKPEGKISYLDALKAGLVGNIQMEKEGVNYEVKTQGFLEEIVNSIKNIKKYKEIKTPSSFNGELRPYQEEALSWMGTMCEYGFGVCLADDMGLGKTIEVIVYLLFLKEKYPTNFGSTLIICPTSLLYNWQKEINKFGPSLEVILHHGPDRISKISKLDSYLKAHKVILTSYGTIRNDVDLLKTIHFSGIIVDESQNMKNYEAQQTQAIYQLNSDFRICLSGTPIENRLLELWTLFEFLNPGLLGERKSFQKNFVNPIEQFQDEDVISKLQNLISPFILRRVKTDKSIIKDLPDKREMKIYVQLTDIQKELYREVVQKTYRELEGSQKGQNITILSLLTKLKQICNHPSQYLHKSIPKDFKLLDDSFLSQSNKLERLLEMIDEIVEKGEKVLIFTQFTQMGDILYEVLNQKYNFAILYFHGGVSAKKRDKIIKRFQSKKSTSAPILILSLRAGGTGLNLTEATTVFHYDRWWNPAVESQATDRAYRIGQTKEVSVYKFIAKGTIEEKIDNLLEEKSELVESIISSGEGWISNLSENKLKEILSLED
jgi:SNF2 family DNA or RNA helicase